MTKTKGRLKTKRLLNIDYKGVLTEIDTLVNNDWGFDVDYKLALDRPRGYQWTQEETDELARIVMGVYKLSHGVHNGCCVNHKYLIKNHDQD